MPPQKRPLAEADANVSKASEPARKKISTGNTNGGKENRIAPDYDSKTVAELKEILKERSISHTGKKSLLIDRLTADDAEHGVANNRTSSASKPSDGPTIRGLDFVTLCRPPDDIDKEKWDKKQEARDEGSSTTSDEVEDENEDEESAVQCGTASCMCRKPAAEHPEWKWVMSTEGLKVLHELQDEEEKRDQDAFGEYHFNDFSGYGYQEVVENHLVKIDKVLKKKNPDIVKLWPLMEGFAHFLNEPGPWLMIDDSDRLLDTVKLIGHAVLCTIKVVEQQGLLRADSPLRDIPLVFGLYYNLHMLWPGGQVDEVDQLFWVHNVAFKAWKHGIAIQGAPYGIEKSVTKYTPRGEKPGILMRIWDNYTWTEMFEKYKKLHTTSSGTKNNPIGGRHYDLTKKKGGPKEYITMRPGEDIWF